MTNIENNYIPKIKTKIIKLNNDSLLIVDSDGNSIGYVKDNAGSLKFEAVSSMELDKVSRIDLDDADNIDIVASDGTKRASVSAQTVETTDRLVISNGDTNGICLDTNDLGVEFRTTGNGILRARISNATGFGVNTTLGPFSDNNFRNGGSSNRWSEGHFVSLYTGTKIDFGTSALIFNLVSQSSVPVSPAAEDIYLDDGTNTEDGLPHWRQYDGSDWSDIGGIGSGATYTRYESGNGAALSPGGSGATFVVLSANNPTGYNLDADTEYLYFSFPLKKYDSGDITISIHFIVDEAGAALDDVVAFDVDYSVIQDRDVGPRTYSTDNDASVVVDDVAQYTAQVATMTIPEANVFNENDEISLRINLDTTNSDIADVIVYEISASYTALRD